MDMSGDKFLKAVLLKFGRAIAMTGALALFATGAHATLIVQFDDVSNGLGYDTTISDAGPGDLHPVGGTVSTVSVVGTSVFSITAQSGAPNKGELVDINLLMTLAPNADFIIRIADNGFMLQDRPSVSAASFVTPTTVNHEITVQTYVDGQIVLNSDPLVSFQNQSAGALVAVAEPTTIEHIIRLKSGNYTGTSTFDTRTYVAGPPMLGLLGMGLLGLLALRRRA